VSHRSHYSVESARPGRWSGNVEPIQLHPDCSRRCYRLSCCIIGRIKYEEMRSPIVVNLRVHLPTPFHGLFWNIFSQATVPTISPRKKRSHTNLLQRKLIIPLDVRSVSTQKAFSSKALTRLTCVPVIMIAIARSLNRGSLQAKAGSNRMPVFREIVL